MTNICLYVRSEPDSSECRTSCSPRRGISFKFEMQATQRCGGNQALTFSPR